MGFDQRCVLTQAYNTYNAATNGLCQNQETEDHKTC